MESKSSSSSSLLKTNSRKSSNRLICFLLLLLNAIKNFLLLFVPIRLTNSKNVKNKVILITGGANGIGKLMALKFLKLGAKIIVWDINIEFINQTKLLTENYKNQIYFYQIDITKKESIYKLSKQITDEIGPIDILINNAGIVFGRNILELTDEQIEKTINVNLLSHFYTIRTFLPKMIDKKSGHIVSIASLAGEFGVSQLTDYCATKFGVIGLIQSLRLELAASNLDDKIKTTVVKPWLISTGLFAGANSGLFSILKPDYVADKIVEGIIHEQEEISIPTYLHYIAVLIKFEFLNKCLTLIFDFLGGFESMNNFQGRYSKKKN